jgi:hypothetical protein
MSGLETVSIVWRAGEENGWSFLNDENIRCAFELEIISQFTLIKSKQKIKAFWLFNNLKVSEDHYTKKVVELHGQKMLSLWN